MNRHIIHSLQGLLQQLQQALSQLTEEQYQTSIPLLSGASIGQHMRHVIEFFQILNQGYYDNRVNYDARRRHSLLETNHSAATQALYCIMHGIDKPDKPLWLNVPMGNDVVTLCTHYSRELVYNLEHTIHHMALLKIGITAITNIALPDNFGVAASTMQYRKQTICAQ